MHRWKHAFWALLFPLGLTAQVDATQAEVSTSRILFVLDASNSMYGRWDEGTKMEIAQRLMSSMLDSLSQVPNPQFQLALLRQQVANQQQFLWR